MACILLGLTVLKCIFSKKPKLILCGYFATHHKTLAMGIPLINAIYEGRDDIALLALPLLLWHPIELFCGSAIAPKLGSWILKK